MKRALVLIGLISSMAWTVIPSQAASVQLKVVKITTNVNAAPSGTRVVFRARAENLGPGTADLWVDYENPLHLAGIRETCLVPASETGDFGNVSPDDPFCEWDFVPEGDYVFVKVEATLEGTPGEHAELTFCAFNGNCKTAKIVITR